MSLNKCNIYLFVSNSIESVKINQYQTFQLILLMQIDFMWSYKNGIIPQVSHRPLYFVFIEANFEK